MLFRSNWKKSIVGNVVVLCFYSHREGEFTVFMVLTRMIYFCTVRCAFYLTLDRQNVERCLIDSIKFVFEAILEFTCKKNIK